LRSSNELKIKNKDFFKKNIPISKTNFTNIHKSNFLGSTLNKSQPQSDQSAQEIKIFKLSDFGLCVNVHKSQPLQFGCNTYLAPEICQLGPDNPRVCKIFNF
jgi:CRISPR/Cas system CMR-associated protein Cmr1 (group 7 of RAMP superfamily)